MEQTLIAQALAVVEESRPVKFGDSIPVTPEQALVWTIYSEVEARDRGHGSEDRVEKSIKAARGVGIPGEEITAAVAAGEEAGKASIGRE